MTRELAAVTERARHLLSATAVTARAIRRGRVPAVSAGLSNAATTNERREHAAATVLPTATVPPARDLRVSVPPTASDRGATTSERRDHAAATVLPTATVPPVRDLHASVPVTASDRAATTNARRDHAVVTVRTTASDHAATTSEAWHLEHLVSVLPTASDRVVMTSEVRHHVLAGIMAEALRHDLIAIELPTQIGHAATTSADPRRVRAAMMKLDPVAIVATTPVDLEQTTIVRHDATVRRPQIAVLEARLSADQFAS